MKKILFAVVALILAVGVIDGLHVRHASAASNAPLLCYPGLGCVFTASRPAADSGIDFVLNTTSTRTAGKLLSVQNGGVEKLAYDFNGKPIISCAAVKTAVAAPCGTVALDTSGTVTVTTTAVTASSIVDVQLLTAAGTAGGLYRVAPADITAGTSFIIRAFVSSTAGAATAATSDTSTVAWQILN